MTDLEKFYQLALNIVNSKFKTLEIFENEIDEIKVSQLHTELIFYPDIKRIELFGTRYLSELLIVGKDYPDKIDELIRTLKFCGYDESLFEGIE